MAIDEHIHLGTTKVLTGTVNYKRIGAYVKQSHKENDIRVHVKNGEFLIADSFVCVKVPQVGELFPFTFFQTNGERATFRAKQMQAEEGGPDIWNLWNEWISTEMEEIRLSDMLKELPGDRNKPGHLYRKFAYPDTWTPDLERVLDATYISKKMCDALSPDLDELEGFLFEQYPVSKSEKPVRVIASVGPIMVLMPLAKRSGDWRIG